MRLTDVDLAPAFRLSSAASHVWVDFIFGGALLLCVLAAAAWAWRAWVHGAALHAELWKVHGLTPGLVLLAGIAEPVEEEGDAAQRDPHFAPFVELTIHQRGEERRTKNGRYVRWAETSRSLTERPFVLHSDAGTRIRVEPSGDIDLVDRLEPPIRSGRERTRVARITPGERIWVRGALTTSGRDTGPYRGTDRRLTLSPPPHGPLFISSQPVEKEDRDRARVHGICALVLLGALILLQAVIFAPYRALRTRGVPTNATIAEKQTWVTHSKNSSTLHYGLVFDWNTNGRAQHVRDEVGSYGWMMCGVGDPASIVYDPDDPTTMQAGRRDNVGVTIDRVFGGSLITLVALLTWAIVVSSTKPWWRKKKLNETTQGPL